MKCDGINSDLVWYSFVCAVRSDICLDMQMWMWDHIPVLSSIRFQPVRWIFQIFHYCAVNDVHMLCAWLCVVYVRTVLKYNLDANTFFFNTSLFKTCVWSIEPQWSGSLRGSRTNKEHKSSYFDRCLHSIVLVSHWRSDLPCSGEKQNHVWIKWVICYLLSKKIYMKNVISLEGTVDYTNCERKTDCAWLRFWVIHNYLTRYWWRQYPSLCGGNTCLFNWNM